MAMLGFLIIKPLFQVVMFADLASFISGRKMEVILYSGEE